MKSSSAEPDFVRMSRSNAAMEAWLRSTSSVTMAGSVSIGVSALSYGVPPRPLSGRAGMKSPSYGDAVITVEHVITATAVVELDRLHPAPGQDSGG